MNRPTGNHVRQQRLAVLITASSLILLTFGLRVWGLNATSLWYDEAFMLYHARQGVWQGLRGLLQEDNALPLYGLLLSLWIRVAGGGEFAARYLSTLLGAITAPLMLRLGAAVAGRRGGGLGSLLAYATLPIFVYYAQEVRMYALAIPLATAFLWIAWRLIARGRGACTYVALGTAMLLAHPYAGLAWASAGLWGTLVLVVSDRPRQHVPGTPRLGPRARTWLVANLVLVVLALPIAAWALWRVRADATAVSAVPLDALHWIPVLFGVGQYLYSPWPVSFVLVALLSLLAAGIWGTGQQPGRTRLWLAVNLILPIMILLVLLSVKAKWSERYLLPSWGIALAAGIGIGWETLIVARPGRSQLVRAALATAGLVLLGAWTAMAIPALARQAEGTWAVALRDEWHPRPDFRGIAQHILARGKPDDAIVVVGGYAVPNLELYYGGPAHLFGLPYDARILDTNRALDLRALQILERETVGRKRLWLVLWQQHLADPTDLVQSILVESCRRLPVDAGFTNVSLLLFDLETCGPLDRLIEPPIRLQASFEAPIELLGYDILTNETLWEVDLWWETEAPLAEDYRVFVHLLAADGELLAQHDHIAGADAYPSSRWRPGTRLRDRFFLDLEGPAASTACRACRLHVGLYTPDRRLELQSGGDTIVIPLDSIGLP